MGENAEVAGWVRLYDSNDPVEEFSHGPEKPREWRDEDCARVVFHADHERAVAQHKRIVAGSFDLLREVLAECKALDCDPCIGSMAPWEDLCGRIDAFLAQTAEGV